MLALPVTSDADIAYLNHWLKVMEGWEWNLIPMFLIGIVVATLSVWTYRKESVSYTSVRTREEKY